jgi:large repetitive protein
MGTLTLDISARGNLPPSSSGWKSILLAYGATHIFTLANFTTETSPPYADPEGDPLDSIKITLLPSQGVLKKGIVAVIANDQITSAELTAGDLTYESDSGDTEGYSDGFMRFTVSDTGSSTFTTSPKVVTFIVDGNINLPPSQVGYGEADMSLGQVFTFTEASLTSSLNPPYADPENNPPYKLLITSLPSFGSLKLSGTNVVAGQEINWSDVQASNLTYVSELLPTGGIEGFEFMISDTGSQQYIG